MLAKIPELKAWASDVEAWALARVQAGTQIPGFKVVAGRSIRKYTDEAAVAEAAKAAGYTDIWDKRLIGITAMELLMGKRAFTETLGELVVSFPNPTRGQHWSESVQLQISPTPTTDQGGRPS